ncbi:MULTISPECIES: autoinducer binding domain-containing protein [unclassified Methylobacterium]|uniref:autoinducer binding domain-containing protein n=1 Tax=unclassified Methylobacterium TaxID=2615210 RepID=UPI0006FB1C8B|nr:MULTISPECIES: autoinducer binding domain-containing protein [unclassified Methylobacterium]KQP73162.1 autoinducer-binding protein [Methylobacterium sp. Leaf113]KQP92244.1 autoinducer-binding protein [Methylobacterium sp. Leaf117]MCK2052656.1 autoinducer binding domain-containing protein [Methylobacterium sp. 37f]
MTRKALDQTLGFLRSLDRTASVDDVARLLVTELAAFGVAHAMAGTVPGKGTPARQQQSHILVNTFPSEWGRRYLTRGYAFHDPTVRHLSETKVPFAWSDLRSRIGDDSEARRVMDEAGEFRLRDGVTIPLMTLEGGTAGFSLSGEHLAIDPDDRPMLHLIATYAFGHLLRLRGEGSLPRTIRLAPREREALQWAAEGKTDWEIGEVMGISTHGVDFHLRSARTKLGTTNRTQAVAVALRRGLIL